MRLQGKTALVTAAGQGIGYASAIALAAEGAQVWATDVNETLLERYAASRVRDNRVVSAFTHSLVKIFSNDYAPLAIGRGLGLIAVDLFPPLKRRLIRITSGLAGRLPRLARGLPAPPR